MKKFIFTFIIALVFFSFSTQVYAVTYTDVSDPELTNILDILDSYNVINGYTDNTFRSGNCVTRAEAAKIVVTLLGYEDFSHGLVSEFTDMNNHWAGRYTEVTNALDLITGYEDDTFRPDEYILFDDAVRIIVKILGYKSSTLNSDDYMKIAKSLNLLKNTDNISKYVTRKNMANLIYNALSCNIVEIIDGKTVTTANTLFNNLGSKKTEEITDTFAIEHPEYDLSAYMLNTCDVYYDRKNNIVLVNNPMYETISGIVKSALPSDDIFLNDKYITKLYNISNANIIFNGMSGNISNSDIKNSDARLVINEKSEVIGVVLEKSTDIKVISPKDIYVEGSNKFSGKNLPVIAGNTDYDHIIVTGAVSSLSDITIDDVVYFYETKEADNITSILKLNVVRKSVNGTYNGSYLKIYDKYYNISNNGYKLNSNCIINEAPQAGDSIKAILDKDNTVLEVVIEKYAKKPDSYGYVLSVNEGTTGLPYITMIDVDGKTLTYRLKENCGVVSADYRGNTVIYYTSINKNDFIKYDLLNSNTIKIAEKAYTSYIYGSYNSTYSSISNIYSITGSSSLLASDSYSKMTKESLGYYVEGKAIIENSSIKLMLISKNLVNAEPTGGDNTPVIPPTPATPVQPPTPQLPTVTTYTGTLYGAIKNYDDKANQLTMLNYSYTFALDKGLTSYINNYKNSFVKIKVINNVITEINSIKPEITKSKVTAVYKERLEIDKKSYVEYSSDVKVYICSKDENGNYTSFTGGSISDVVINSQVEFFITNNRYDGVVNVIVVYK